MNEKIKELAEQAGMVKILEEHASEYGNGMFENTPYPELEKFAELIVRECIEQCTANDSNDEWDKGVRWAANQIKQHFGVEE